MRPYAELARLLRARIRGGSVVRVARVPGVTVVQVERRGKPERQKRKRRGRSQRPRKGCEERAESVHGGKGTIPFWVIGRLPGKLNRMRTYSQ